MLNQSPLELAKLALSQNNYDAEAVLAFEYFKDLDHDEALKLRECARQKKKYLKKKKDEKVGQADEKKNA